MPDRDEPGWRSDDRAPSRRREGFLGAFLRASARALEAEQDRWFLWLPVLFAGRFSLISLWPMSPSRDLPQRLCLAA